MRVEEDPAVVFETLLARDPERWRSGADTLLRELESRRCTYGGRRMVSVLRPKVLGSGEYAYLDYACGVLMGAFRRLADMVLADEGLRTFLGVTPLEAELAMIEPRCPDPCALARLDTFMTAEGLRFVELNGEAPAGPGYCEVTSEAFVRHPLIQEWMRRTGAEPLSTMEGLIRGLLMIWRASGGRRRPRILITDYLDGPTVSEFYIMQEYMERAGLETVVEDPRALEYRGGRLVAGGRPVDFVYRRLLTNEMIDHMDDLGALLGAYRDGAVVLADPFRAKLAHKKTAFALLSGDHLGSGWLTEEERRVVERHVPWTRRIRETRTDYHGRQVDLLPFLVAERERFVFKPADDYGGRGVLAGWECTESECREYLEEALSGLYVAQERVAMIPERFPVIEEGLRMESMIVDLDPYVYMGRVHGVLARLSAGGLCNVTSGGGQVPVFLHPAP